MLQGGEGRVGAGEHDDAQGVGIWNVRPRWPFGHQHGGTKFVIVAPQEAEVNLEVVHQSMKEIL
jgi:hypothetical protein